MEFKLVRYERSASLILIGGGRKNYDSSKGLLALLPVHGHRNRDGAFFSFTDYWQDTDNSIVGKRCCYIFRDVGKFRNYVDKVEIIGGKRGEEKFDVSPCFHAGM